MSSTGVQLLQEEHEVSGFLSSVSNAPFLALDTETSGLDPHTEELLLIQFGTATEQALIDAQRISTSAIQEIFKPGRTVVMHNAAFDLKMLWACFGKEIDLEHARIADTQLCERILRNGRKSDIAMGGGWALKKLAERYAGMDLDKSIRQGFYGIRSVEELSEAELRYAQRDVEATWKVFAEQLPQLKRDGLLKTAAIEGAATLAFAQIELKGAPLDDVAWRKLLEDAKGERVEARKSLDREFWTVADRDLFGGTTLNYDSDQEVLDALGRLGVQISTTRREALLATGHSAAKAVAEYREHQKIVSTYGEGFLAHVHKKTGRLHPRFKPLGASTGRSSCSEPNLQNIPSGSAFRDCFRGGEGRKIVTADYEGAELRIIAEVSKDPVFIETLGDGGDLHAIVASRIFKKRVSKTEHPDLRARAKAINFGLAYGMGAGGLATQIGVSQKEAETLLEEYFRSFPRIRSYLEESANEALHKGYASTIAGRRFWFVDMRRDGKDEGMQRRVAKNMPIQGTNADMIKVAMARIVCALAEQNLDGFLVNMVHDEVVAEASEQDAEAVHEVVVNEMISAGAEFVRVVPISVDAKIADAWSK